MAIGQNTYEYSTAVHESSMQPTAHSPRQPKSPNIRDRTAPRQHTIGTALHAKANRRDPDDGSATVQIAPILKPSKIQRTLFIAQKIEHTHRARHCDSESHHQKKDVNNLDNGRGTRTNAAPLTKSRCPAMFSFEFIRACASEMVVCTRSCFRSWWMCHWT